MPIEDIDFLGANSEVDSTLFFLDSASRDRKVFPTPAEYVIEFSEPIKLVVGVDILDATIPAAMYVVDSHSDSLPVITLSGSDPMTTFEGIQCEPFEAALASSSRMYGFLVADVDLDKVKHACDLYLTKTQGPADFIYVVLVRTAVVGSSRTSWHDVSYRFSSSSAMDELAESIDILLYMRKAIVQFERGNYDIVSLMSQVAVSLRAVCIKDADPDPSFASFDVVSTSSGTVSLQGRYAITNSSTPFILDMRAMPSSIANVLGFSTLPLTNAPALGLGYCSVAGMTQGFGSVMSNSVISLTCFSNSIYTFGPAHHIVVAPGIANLLGVRYIVLRCPEIEQHLYSGMTFGSHSSGIGVFKLPSGNEVSNLRFDFVSLVRKPFHPIGRISRLTLRFEMDDGSLYDFKGVNTQILLAVKFLSPGKRVLITKSVLNPDYNPDFLKYISRPGINEALAANDSAKIGLLQAHTNYIASTDTVDDEDTDDFEDSDTLNYDIDMHTHARAKETHMDTKRQDIARKLLQEQDKYDYPSRENDTATWRAPSI